MVGERLELDPRELRLSLRWGSSWFRHYTVVMLLAINAVSKSLDLRTTVDGERVNESVP